MVVMVMMMTMTGSNGATSVYLFVPTYVHYGIDVQVRIHNETEISPYITFTTSNPPPPRNPEQLLHLILLQRFLPSPTCSHPILSPTYRTCLTTCSRVAFPGSSRGSPSSALPTSSLHEMNPGLKFTITTPPFRLTASNTLSGTFRGCGQMAYAPEGLNITGARLPSHTTFPSGEMTFFPSPSNVHHRLHARVRQIHNHPQPVHLPHQPPARGAHAVPDRVRRFPQRMLGKCRNPRTALPQLCVKVAYRTPREW
jgi:hypothetical protein